MTCVLAGMVVAGQLILGSRAFVIDPSNASAIEARAALAWGGVATLPDV
jgi:hypothetical protein